MNAVTVLFLLTIPQGGEESTLERVEREIAAVVEKSRPSVVQVSARVGDEAFESNIAVSHTRQLTGIIVSPDGFILTDLGAVEPARYIVVTLHDGRKLPAERKGSDRITAVALLRVRAEGLKPAEFAEGNAVRQGSFAVLVSNPAGLRGSCSVGFVTGLNRTVQVGGIRYENLIQTSAAVQSGDAGGLLANSRGLVLGMIHSRYVPDGLAPDPAGFTRPVPREGFDFVPSGGASVGFATPAPTLKFVADRLMKQGKVVRGWAGLGVRRIGVISYVSAVAPAGPASKAGVRAGDGLISFDGKPVTDLSALKRSVVETPATKTVRVVVLRGRAQMELDLTIEPEPAP